jgi:hypothetical protein
MAAYAVTYYSTGPQDTVDEVLALLETKLETLDDSTNTIRHIKVDITGRDREQAIGWVLYDG